ncbi:hypothetical protein AOLI_G00103150 [Acnodon oligacanthus]
MGILVVKDPPSLMTHSQKAKVPGLLGMNIINGCYEELFHQHGPAFLNSKLVQVASEALREALFEWQKLDCIPSSGYLGKVRSKGRASTCIPAGSLKMVPATCAETFGHALPYALYEPNTGFASYYRFFVEGFSKCVAPLDKMVGLLQNYSKAKRGYCPFELMFGQKPHLPVDALLGVVEEGGQDGPAEDWVKEHQEHLQSAYALANCHLQDATAQRIKQQPEGNAVPLPIGTVVYCKNHLLGRHKIQDVWDSTRYKIVKCLDEVGRVYTISPVEGYGQEKNVHQNELRVAPGSVMQASTDEDEGTAPSPVSVVRPQDDEGEEMVSVVVVTSRDLEPGEPLRILGSPGPPVSPTNQVEPQALPEEPNRIVTPVTKATRLRTL